MERAADSGRYDYVIQPSLRHRRRFSGDDLFPEGRYHTIATDESGGDGRALMGELYAYRNIKRTGSIEIYDLGDPEVRRQLSAARGEPVPDKKVLEVGFFPVKDEVTPFAKAMGQDVCAVHLVEIPYVVEWAQIDGVLDLRLPSAQQWFLDTFGRPREIKIGEGIFSWKLLDPTHYPTFVHMLGSLIHYEFGGSDFTNMVADVLRLSDVNGLSYPSARTNSGLLVVNGQFKSHSGWNFVDYRQTKTNVFFGGRLAFDPRWPGMIVRGAEVETPTEPEYAGSWKTNGLWEANYRMIQNEIRDYKAMIPD